MKNYEYLYYQSARDIKRQKRQKVAGRIFNQAIIIVSSYVFITLVLMRVF